MLEKMEVTLCRRPLDSVSVSPSSRIGGGLGQPTQVGKSRTATGQKPPLPSAESQVGGYRQSPLSCWFTQKGSA